ncbi:MAG: c-type cytochrome [Gemmatimonadaceae bacterium]|nr:c-type cytochrome [Gemmatimonadaceae bacterium]
MQPGIHPQVVFGNLKNPYVGDKTAAAAGRQLFLAYNCYGCHGGRAGGGMGPSLRDSTNTYGTSDAQLFATISEGRPAGMPAWGGRIPENQIWQIITYIRTLRTPQEPDRVQVARNEVPMTKR